MVQGHCSTVDQRVEAVSYLMAHSGSYGVVTHRSRADGGVAPDALHVES